MRILYIHQYFRTRASASSTRSYEFARRWVAGGHSVTVITGSAISDDRTRRLLHQSVDGIDVLTVPTRYSQSMSFARRILAFVAFMVRATWAAFFRVGRVDVVFATSTPLTVGIPGYLASLQKRVPFVFEIRDLWPEAPIQLGALRHPVPIAAARWLEKALYRAARRIVTLSPGMLAALRDMGVPEGKLAMIPNCCDLDLFTAARADAALRARYGLRDEFVVIYAGAMGRANGLEVVIEAARVLQQRGQKSVIVLLVGDGSEHPSLVRLATEYALGNLRFVPSMPKVEFAEFMRVADVCLTIFAHYPVLQTNSPNKFFDSLALGRPVVINYGGWMQQVLERERAGIAVPSNDPDHIADAVIALRDQPDLAAEMGRNARRLAERDYDREVLSRQLLDLLQDVVAQAGSRRP